MEQRRAAVTSCPACGRSFQAPGSGDNATLVPRVLLCGHSLCTGCANERAEDDELLGEHVVTCTLCKSKSTLRARPERASDGDEGKQDEAKEAKEGDGALGFSLDSYALDLASRLEHDPFELARVQKCKSCGGGRTARGTQSEERWIDAGGGLVSRRQNCVLGHAQTNARRSQVSSATIPSTWPRSFVSTAVRQRGLLFATRVQRGCTLP